MISDGVTGYNSSYVLFVCFHALRLSQQLWYRSWGDGQFTKPYFVVRHVTDCVAAWYSYKFNQKTLLLTVTLQTVKTQVKITTDCGILSACIHLAKIQTNFQGMKKFGTPTLIIGTIVFSHILTFLFLCLIRFFTSQSTIFQLCWDVSSWL